MPSARPCRLLFLAAADPGEPERVIWATTFDPEHLPLTIKLPLQTDVDAVRVERVARRPTEMPPHQHPGALDDPDSFDITEAPESEREHGR